MKKNNTIAGELAEKTLRELGMGKYGNLREDTGDKRSGSLNPPVNSLKLPFRIPVIEKTARQWQSPQGYKASAHWQTASLLRDLVQLYLEIIPSHQFRRKSQLEDAARSMVATIEEGWARPSTKEYLDYLGFSQASLTEVRGDVERLHTDGYLRSGKYGNEREFKGIKIESPSRNFPYPPVNSRMNPGKYGKIRERLREYTGREIRPADLTYEVFIEFINKIDFLMKRTIFGLQEKVVNAEKTKLNEKLETHIRKYG